MKDRLISSYFYVAVTFKLWSNNFILLFKYPLIWNMLKGFELIPQTTCKFENASDYNTVLNSKQTIPTATTAACGNHLP